MIIKLQTSIIDTDAISAIGTCQKTTMFGYCHAYVFTVFTQVGLTESFYSEYSNEKKDGFEESLKLALEKLEAKRDLLFKHWIGDREVIEL